MSEAASMRPRNLFGRILHLIFETSLLLKAIFGVAEMACGAALALVSTQSIVALVQRLTLSELTADPDDPIAGALLGFAQGVSVDAQSFFAAYLALHGIIKLVLVLALMRGYRWAYPVSIAAFGLFVAYQLDRFTSTGSPGLVVLSVFDVILIALIAREWRQAVLAAGQAPRCGSARSGETRRTASEIPTPRTTPRPLATRSSPSRERPTSG